MHSYIRKRNQTYYYRIKVPLDLAHLIPAKEIKQSLKTNDIDAAKIAGAAINAKVQSLFGLLRAGMLCQEQTPELIASYLPRKPLLSVRPESPICGNGRPLGRREISRAHPVMVQDSAY